MEESILQLLYSGDDTNFELALQLIKGLAPSEIKDKLKQRLKDLKRCASTFGFVDIQSIFKGRSLQTTTKLMGPHLAAMPKIVETITISQSYKAPDADLQSYLPMLGNAKALYLQDALPAQLYQCWGLDSLEEIYTGLRGQCELNPSNANCPKLHTLVVSTSKGKLSINPSISNLPALRKLTINARDSGVILCPELADLPQLADFSCESLKNQDKAFQILAACPNLKRLEARFDEVTQAPNALATSSLERLFVMRYALDTFFELPPTLKALTLENPLALTEIPKNIAQLPNLRILSITGIALKKLPDFIFDLPDELEILQLSGTEMTNTQINFWTEKLARRYEKTTIEIEE